MNAAMNVYKPARVHYVPVSKGLFLEEMLCL